MKLTTAATTIRPISQARKVAARILPSSMDPAAVQRWIEVWARGWAEHDVDAIASLYADGAGHRSEPFRERGNPRDYAAWAFSDEQHAEVWFAEARVIGDAG